MRETRARFDEEELRKRAAILTVTGRYRESLNIMIYLMDRRNRQRNLPLIIPRPTTRSSKSPKC